MSNLSTSQAYSPHGIEALSRMPRQRTRTMSLLSVSSTSSFKSLLEMSMTPPASPTVSEQSNTYYASFSPLRSATTQIRDLGITCRTTKALAEKASRRRRVTFKETVSLESSEDEDEDNAPYIARAHHHQPHSRLGPAKTILVRRSSPSSSSSSSSIDLASNTSLHRRSLSHPCHRSHAHCTDDDVVMPTSLHPILAKLEKSSRFCTQTIYCSTCGKSGSDYPRCAKCGEQWCSRSCRLVGGKRHVCPTH
ncbi:hypothetical protein CPB83DRAFT_539323 [Crepidotus variabilis]|uniref:Uncharacterized protein n=1 Tax=Crepidotus variabilis TaxID=179855 RepID=A0A9P6JV94_9AGAR|nr:hypothetical protein CPB83DRAFT_539323 [Crepidotus variabilis]